MIPCCPFFSCTRGIVFSAIGIFHSGQNYSTIATASYGNKRAISFGLCPAGCPGSALPKLGQGLHFFEAKQPWPTSTTTTNRAAQINFLFRCKRPKVWFVFYSTKVGIKLKQNVLIAPLNWGIGHVTRMIPIARYLRSCGVHVYVAASGRALQAFRSEVPDLTYLQWDSFEMRYYRRLPASLAILIQLPKFLFSVWRDHRRLEALLHSMRFDLILADGRYGMWSHRAYCVFVTHQLRIPLPGYLRWASPLVNRWNRWRIGKFRQCWVPDVADIPNLSGELSHNFSVPIPLRFIGPLSRFAPCPDATITWDWVCVLSGPEPARSQLEQIIIQQIDKLHGSVLLIRGRPGRQANQIVQTAAGYYQADFLTTNKLQRVLCSARWVICRSGYSTLMDLALCGSKALLIPTPGQPEQRYLAKKMQAEGVCPMMDQDRLDLSAASTLLESYSGFASTPWPQTWKQLLRQHLKQNEPRPKEAGVPDAEHD